VAFKINTVDAIVLLQIDIYICTVHDGTGIFERDSELCSKAGPSKLYNTQYSLSYFLLDKTIVSLV